MRILLPAMMLSLAILGGGCAKEVCPGESAHSPKYNSPARFSSDRETKRKAKPSMIHTTKGSSSKRKPPPPPVYYSESNNSGKKKAPK